MVKPNLIDFSSKNPKIKYSCAKRCIAFSKEKPELLYADLDFFINLLDNENNIFKWTALQVIGNLSRVDKDKKIDKLIPKLITFINSGKLITASNAILGLAEIARNKPEFKDKIFREFIEVEHYKYNTLECTNVVIQNLIKTLFIFKDELKDKEYIIEFLKRQKKNIRVKVKILAEELLEQIEN